MARSHRPRGALLLAAFLLLLGVVNALVAWYWPQHPAWLGALVAFDFVAFAGIFAMFHFALDPPRGGLPPPRFERSEE